MSLVKWIDREFSPFSQTLIENFFTDSIDFSNSISKGLTIPAINIRENDEDFEFEVAAPGKNKDQFNIEVVNNNLVVSSVKSEEDILEKDNYTKMEYNYNSFKRVFSLPQNVDKTNVKAKYENGILKITIAKQEETNSTNKVIPIK